MVVKLTPPSVLSLNASAVDNINIGWIVGIDGNRFRVQEDLSRQLLPRHAAVGALEQNAIVVDQVKIATARRQGERDGIAGVGPGRWFARNMHGFSCCQRAAGVRALVEIIRIRP